MAADLDDLTRSVVTDACAGIDCTVPSIRTAVLAHGWIAELELGALRSVEPVRLFEALTASRSASGLYPVALGDFAYLAPRPHLDRYPALEQPFDQLRERSLAIDPAPRLRERGEEAIEDIQDAERRLVDPRPTSPEEAGFWPDPAPEFSDETPWPATIVLVPVATGWEAALYLGWVPGNAGGCADVAAILRHFEERYGARLAKESWEDVYLMLPEPIGSAEEAWHATLDRYGAGDRPDEDLREVAAEMRYSRQWMLGWR